MLQCASPDHASHEAFLQVRRADARRRSVRRDRCEATRCATRLGLICHVGGSQGPAAYGPDGMKPSATQRNSAASGQLVGSWTRIRARCSITRAPILTRRSLMVANSHLASGFAPRDRGAHAMHQPERGGVEDEPHLIGGRAVTRHAIRRQLRLVQLDQVLHLPALAIDGLVKMPRRALERGDDVADVDLLAHAGRPCDRLQRALEPRHDFARPPPAAGLVQEAHIGAQLRLAAHRMIKAQIDRGLRHQGVECGIAGEAKNVVRTVLPAQSIASTRP